MIIDLIIKYIVTTMVYATVVLMVFMIGSIIFSLLIHPVVRLLVIVKRWLVDIWPKQ